MEMYSIDQSQHLRGVGGSRGLSEGPQSVATGWVGRVAEMMGGCACPSGRVTTLLILKEGLVWRERELCRGEVGEERGGILESRRKNEKRKMGSEVGRVRRGGNGRVPERREVGRSFSYGRPL